MTLAPDAIAWLAMSPSPSFLTVPKPSWAKLYANPGESKLLSWAERDAWIKARFKELCATGDEFRTMNIISFCRCSHKKALSMTRKAKEDGILKFDFQTKAYSLIKGARDAK
jgi:hypothetical protein